MNTIEGRIRAATHAAANTVPPDGVPPLDLPGHVVPVRRRRGWAVLAGRGPTGGGPAGGGWAAGEGQRSRWVAPVAAAVAVVVVAVAASVIAGRGTAAGPTAGQESAADSTYVAELVKSGQIPPYYLDGTGTGSDSINGSAYVVVRATATGKALGTIRPSVPGDGIMGVTGAADDRTFILDEQPPAKRDIDLGREPHTFYEVRLDAAGKPGPATKLPLSLPKYGMLGAISLSPDGSKLAMAVQPFTDGGENLGSGTVTVYTLATGQSHSWTGNGQVSLGQHDLSWSSDGQTLAFPWSENFPDGAVSGFRVLDLAQGGGNLEADSHKVVPFYINGNTLGCTEAGVTMTADGSALICVGGRVVNPNAAPDRQQSQSGFLEFSTATGKLLRVLGGRPWPSGDVPPPLGVYWSNASGSLVIGTKDARDLSAKALIELGVQSATGFTPLPEKLPSEGPELLAW